MLVCQKEDAAHQRGRPVGLADPLGVRQPTTGIAAFFQTQLENPVCFTVVSRRATRKGRTRDNSPLLIFAGLVALARRPNPIPSRTRPSNSSAPMVLCLKTWESRSSPGLQRSAIIPHTMSKLPLTTKAHNAPNVSTLRFGPNRRKPPTTNTLARGGAAR